MREKLLLCVKNKAKNVAMETKDTLNRRPDRRQQLLSAAYSVIAENGLDGATLKKIAGRAGLGAAAVNFYFNTKQDLLHQVIFDLSKEFEETVLQTSQTYANNPVAGLSAAFEVLLDTGSADSREKICTLCCYYTNQNNTPETQLLLDRSENLNYAMIAEFCKGILAMDDAGKRMNHEAIATAFYSMIDGFWSEAYYHKSWSGPDAHRVLYQSFLGSVFPWAYDLPQHIDEDSAVDTAAICRIATKQDIDKVTDLLIKTSTITQDRDTARLLVEHSVTQDECELFVYVDDTTQVQGFVRVQSLTSLTLAQSLAVITDLHYPKSLGTVVAIKLLQTAQNYAKESGAAAIHKNVNLAEFELRELLHHLGMTTSKDESVMAKRF
ncbi:TetR/AcrR family transcriptional regulator [Candidatus Seongchinamella marina]|uniref:TetR/AcrR family transcriptional regulator n=1 Tax=Candidatus Seongchinamella marina TaxID=2518990 RepID=UPI00242B0F53|nr:TetR/AcrR family transcriptional regulator [Candidatus Seongchinamella marina]